MVVTVAGPRLSQTGGRQYGFLKLEKLTYDCCVLCNTWGIDGKAFLFTYTFANSRLIAWDVLGSVVAAGATFAVGVALVGIACAGSVAKR
jgi:hypothetical protein